MKTRKPTHPGEVLYEDIIVPLGITITEASQSLGISRKTLSEIINGRASLTPQTAIRIALATDTSPESWLLMQTKLDIWNALREKPRNVVKFVMPVK
ncbi:MAG: HigA family addiction module antidote protein [Leptospiraceae bacterium]|nr:HigA family addiction module antidote protein [Leptospiraceae bacterium]